MAVSSSVDLDTLGRVGTALADPTRRRVLVHLTGGPGYPAEMAGQFGTTRANLSNHLTCLRECGLVTATAEGRRIRYELADPRLADALRILSALDWPPATTPRPASPGSSSPPAPPSSSPRSASPNGASAPGSAPPPPPGREPRTCCAPTSPWPYSPG
jgi:ArsR family transcriptional regulator, cadmium/lead-responsive transcriptional repressor